MHCMYGHANWRRSYRCIGKGGGGNTGIHTGGREGGLPPPFEKSPPPPLNQHKYYNKVVLKHKQQQSDKCCSKKGMHLFKDTYNFYKGVVNIGNRYCFLVGGSQMVFPPFSKNPV